MINKTVLEELDEKITLVLERYTLLKKENISIKDENNELRKEIESLNMLVTERNQIIDKLKEDDELKDLELEDISLKISETIGFEIEQRGAFA